MTMQGTGATAAPTSTAEAVASELASLFEQAGGDNVSDKAVAIIQRAIDGVVRLRDTKVIDDALSAVT